MARIRTVKPEFFQHEGLFDLEQETGWPMRIAFEGLWCQADREGRFKWQPRTLKAQVCPFDELDFSRVLDALATRGFLIKYAVGDVFFGLIPTFKSHQIINNKERVSSLPSHDSSDAEVITCTREARDDHATATRAVRKGKEHGKERKGTGKPFVTSEILVYEPHMDTTEVRTSMDEWLAHKRSRGQGYTTTAALEKLLAKFDTPLAFTEAVNHSIANNYAGMFAPNGSNRVDAIQGTMNAIREFVDGT